MRALNWKEPLIGLVSLLVVGFSLVTYGATIVGILQQDRGSDFDDAYMFIRYADNLRAGRGFTWNSGGAQTFGATSVLYVFIIAGLRSISSLPAGVLLSLTSGLLGLLAVAATVAAGVRGLSQRRTVVNLLLAAVIAASLLLQSSFWYHALTAWRRRSPC